MRQCRDEQQDLQAFDLVGAMQFEVRKQFSSKTALPLAPVAIAPSISKDIETYPVDILTLSIKPLELQKS
jgi:hypothetical protein